MKITIVGGSGFIGTRLISEISGHKISNIDRVESLRFAEISDRGDITDLDGFNIPSDTDCVVLLAAEHKDNVQPKSLYYDVNELGTKNVLDQMDLIGCKKLIFTSSVAVYGLNRDNPSEKDKVSPFNDYGLSKWKAEQQISKWFEEDPTGKAVTILRPTVVFGERNRGNVFNLLKAIATKRFLMIGKGENLKSMAYVGNVVSFIKYQLENISCGLNIYNFVDKPDISMNKLVEIVGAKLGTKQPPLKIPIFLGYVIGLLSDLLSSMTGRKNKVSLVRIKKFIATTQFDSSKVLSTGWNPPFTLEEGLERTLEYEFLRNNINDSDEVFYTE